MAQARDWQGMKDMSVRLLKERTGEGVDEWNRRIKRERFDDEDELRAWLTKQGVTGYAQSLLVMERFGYRTFSPRRRMSSMKVRFRIGRSLGPFSKPSLKPRWDLARSR